jgi:hypothetical protein
MWSNLLSRLLLTLALSFGDRRGVAGRTEPDDLRPMPHANAAFNRPSEHWSPSGNEDIPLQYLQYRRLTALVS